MRKWRAYCCPPCSQQLLLLSMLVLPSPCRLRPPTPPPSAELQLEKELLEVRVQLSANTATHTHLQYDVKVEPQETTPENKQNRVERELESLVTPVVRNPKVIISSNTTEVQGVTSQPSSKSHVLLASSALMVAIDNQDGRSVVKETTRWRSGEVTADDISKPGLLAITTRRPDDTTWSDTVSNTHYSNTSYGSENVDNITVDIIQLQNVSYLYDTLHQEHPAFEQTVAPRVPEVLLPLNSTQKQDESETTTFISVNEDRNNIPNPAVSTSDEEAGIPTPDGGGLNVVIVTTTMYVGTEDTESILVWGVDGEDPNYPDHIGIKDIILAVCGTVAGLLAVCMLVTFSRCCCNKKKGSKDDDSDTDDDLNTSDEEYGFHRKGRGRLGNTQANIKGTQVESAESITQVTLESTPSHDGPTDGHKRRGDSL